MNLFTRVEDLAIRIAGAERHGADLVVCCEVLEHLKRPEEALRRLQCVVSRHLIISVPREPIRLLLNLARGKYIGSLGNTPGHLQHWSARAFTQLVARYFRAGRGPHAPALDDRLVPAAGVISCRR